MIADEYVDREFGGGALKVTPGHDPNDYEIGQRHGLPVISILDESARMNENGGPYQGLDRFEARKRLWEDMRQAGLVIKEEPYTLNVPRSQRGGEIVEPMISTQWFVRIKPLAEAALEAVRDGRYPHRPRSLYQGVLQLAGKYRGLVHQPPAVVGTPHPGLVLPEVRSDDCSRQDPQRVRIAGAHRSSRIRMCWIPGFPPACGPSRPWAGPKRPLITDIFTQPP